MHVVLWDTASRRSNEGFCRRHSESANIRGVGGLANRLVRYRDESRSPAGGTGLCPFGGDLSRAGTHGGVCRRSVAERRPLLLSSFAADASLGAASHRGREPRLRRVAACWPAESWRTPCPEAFAGLDVLLDPRRSGAVVLEARRRVAGDWQAETNPGPGTLPPTIDWAKWPTWMHCPTPDWSLFRRARFVCRTIFRGFQRRWFNKAGAARCRAIIAPTSCWRRRPDFDSPKKSWPKWPPASVGTDFDRSNFAIRCSDSIAAA